MLLKRILLKYRLRKVKAQFAAIGEGCAMDHSLRLAHPDRIRLGKYVHLGVGVYLNGQGEITIGDHVIFGPEVAVLTSTHNFKQATKIPYDEIDLLKPVIIESFVWIGIRAIILAGVTLGEGCVVGAGAVVTKSFPRGSIVAGNPAKVIGQRDLVSFDKCVQDEQFYLLLKDRGQIQKREVLVNTAVARE